MKKLAEIKFIHNRFHTHTHIYIYTYTYTYVIYLSNFGSYASSSSSSSSLLYLGLLCAMIMYIPPALVIHEYVQSSVGLRSVETNHRAGLIFVAMMVSILCILSISIDYTCRAY